MLNDSGNSDLQANFVRPTNPFTRFKKEDIEQSIPSRFEQMVAKYPDRIAVNAKDQKLTYRELNQAANRVARAILDERGEGEEPVALLFEQSSPPIASILGALKAGKFYVPLDSSFPRARIIYMLGDSKAPLIVTDNKTISFADELSRGTLQVINADELEAGTSKENPGLSLSPDRYSYVIYTSGSTGQPKGVLQNHRNVLHNIMGHTNGLHICKDDRVTFLHSPSYVGSVKDIFGALLNGAAVYPFAVKEKGLASLAAWLIEKEITLFRSVTTLFRQFLITLTGDEKFPKLRLIYNGAEPVYRRDVELYKKHFSPDCLFAHGYASTEKSPAWMCIIDKGTQIPGSRLPVGYAVEGVEPLLLNEAGEEVAPNGIGEIAIKSEYLALGYWKKPGLTKATFLPDPEGGDKRIYLTGDLGRILPDGCLEHLGRKDFQVKIRGHRVEVAEIELALLQFETIREAMVHTQKDKTGNQRLIAYIIPANEHLPTVSALRQELAQSLPDYMVPSAFVVLDELPLTPTGKVDRRALPEPGDERPELDVHFLAPRTLIEEKVSGIWTEVLGLDQIGINDPFLELGGDSLRATQVINRVRAKFHLEIPITILFEAPTVAEMSAIIAQHLTPEGDPDSKERLSGEVERLPDGDMPAKKTSKKF
jgi:amino acid adenylation domain-containing protein